MLLSVSSYILAQEGPKSTTLSELKNAQPTQAPSTAEVMRSRISMAKAYLVVKNYPAAIYELENIRRESKDPTVHRVLNILLMHAYLEQGEYGKAQKFLKELDADASKSADYFAVAGQVISGARSQLARYNALGISIADAALPEAARNDLDGMRETLELVASQSRAKGKKKELSATAAAVFEESSAARGNLGRDAYDQRVWKDQVAEAREQIVNPRTKIIDLLQKPIEEPEITLVATIIEDPDVTKDAEEPAVAEAGKTDTLTDTAPEKDSGLKPVEDEPIEKNSVTERNPLKAADKRPAGSSAKSAPPKRKIRVIKSAERKPASRKEKSGQPNVESTDQVAESRSDGAKDRAGSADKRGNARSPMPIGSLISYATRRVNPVYPVQAKSMRMEGTVKVQLIVDEEGKVSKVEKASGPALLKRAAREAVRKWEFTPFVRDGQPVKAMGYVSFNFNL